MVVQYASKFSRENRVIFNNFRYSLRFLDSYEMLVYIIDTLSNSNGYSTMLPSKIAPLTVTSEGARYHNLWFCD